MSADKPSKKKQVISLYVTMILGVFTGIGVSVINTRLLGPEQFGDLKFLQSMFAFAVLFFTLGLFVTGSRMLAQDKNDSIQEHLTGSLLVLAAIVSIFLSSVIFIFSFYEENIFDNDLANTIRLFSPFLFIFPFQLCVENILQGRNRIYEISALRLLPQLLYIIIAVLFNYFIALDLTSALGIQFVVFGLVILVLIFNLKPKFADVKNHSMSIWKENKGYGLQVYYGSIVGVASAHLGGITIAYYIDNVNVGYYALALAITLPLTMVPNAVGTTFFKDFANTKSIPGKVVFMTIGISVVTLLLFFIVIEDLIVLLYSDEYISVVQLTYLMAFGGILHGFGDLMNRFLGAHGRGTDLRNGAIFVGVANIVGFFVLVGYFGVKGAAVTKFIAGAVYCLSLYIYYYRYQKSMAINNEVQ